jgi:6-pyruvoyltetrahydropterin/6-carboxytetrahydropterin synthase
LDGEDVISIQVEHNFETAHRLPFLGGKCENLHGHSWWVEFDISRVDVEDGINDAGISVEYGEVKKLIRDWIDTYLDHGTMLGLNDGLLEPLLMAHTKMFVFGADNDSDLEKDFSQLPNGFYTQLPWPTVEAVAKMLSDRIQELLDRKYADVFMHLYVNSVKVRETHVNSAIYLQGV